LSKASTLRAYYFASYASLGIFLPFVSPWLVALGVRGAALGVISATRPLAGFFAPVLFGWLADSLGLRGGILKLACFGALLPFVVLSVLAAHDYQLSFLPLLLAIAISSFFRVPMSTIADVSALEHPKSYGSLRLWGSFGFMVSAMVAGKFIDPTAPFPFPTAIALSYLLAFALSFRFPTRVHVPRKPTHKDVIKLLYRPRFAVVLLTATLWTLSHVAYDLCISLHLKALGASPFAISIAWNIGVIAEIALMAYYARLKRSFRNETLLSFGLVATVVRFIGLACATDLTVVFLLQPLHAFTFAVVWLSLMELVKERAPDGLLGSAQGLFSAATSLGTTLGLLAFAPLYELRHGHVTFAVAALMGVFAVVTNHWLNGKSRRAETETA
jgi:PPP family 3-phenylpropionic acid transporter